MSRLGIEPGPPVVSQASTLAKSYSNSLCCSYSEHLQYMYIFHSQDFNLDRIFLHDMIPWGLCSWPKCLPTILPLSLKSTPLATEKDISTFAVITPDSVSPPLEKYVEVKDKKVVYCNGSISKRLCRL
jgi:hypothetical protein